MFDTIADMLRGSAPDDLAHALGTDRTQTRRAMEIGLPALIAGLRDKTLEPGGAQSLAAMLDEDGAALPADLGAYLSAGDASQGAAMLDVAFGDRGEPALSALSSASGLSTRLLAQVMSVLAPLATGVVAVAAERSPVGLRAYLADSVRDLEGKGFGRVVELVSPQLPVNAGGPPHVEVAVDGLDDVEVDDDRGAVVVHGAFPGPDEVLLLDDDIVVESGPATEALTGLDQLDDMASFDREVVNVAPAPVFFDHDLDPDGTALTITETRVDDRIDIEGRGLSSMGWLWWVIGAVLGLVILLFALNQCGDDDAGVAAGDADATVVVPTPDPAVSERQATLDAVLAAYPGVTGEVVGDVAILNGTVADATELSVLDQAVRATGLGVQNNVQPAAPSTGDPAGFTLNDLIAVQPELSTLRDLLQQAGLAEALTGGDGFTLFAPTNEAFAAVADRIAEVQDDPEALKRVLMYHLLIGTQDAATIAASPSLSTMVEGQTIAVSSDGTGVVLNGSVPILLPDARASNGIMHIISTVLFADAAAAVTEELGAELGLAPITFAAGSANLTDEGKAELDKVAEFLIATPTNLEIGGHTDGDGENAFNQELSQDRADAVKNYLVELGVPAESLTAVGYGEEQPVAANDTAENKALNRRIEFKPV